MRPVNLIPSEDRRGDSAPSRTGALSWIIVGALAIAVLAVTVTVLAGNDVAEKEVQVADLEQQEAEAQARAASLAPFANFQQITDARLQTVAALAESRFDWERVMRELARVIPGRVWLIELSGRASGDPGGSSGSLGAIEGPSLTMVGCARSQRDVARTISAIGDIDGVTRVVVPASEKPGGASGNAQSAGPAGDCRTRNFVTKFELVAAFDMVPVPAGATPPVTTAPPAGSPSPATGVADEQPPADGGAGEAQQARTGAAKSVAEANEKAENAADLASGGQG